MVEQSGEQAGGGEILPELGQGPAVDRTMPDGRWAFDASVTDVFSDMLARSIPQYEVMRRAVLDVGSRYVKQHTDVVDLGCSRGDALAPFVDRFGAHNRFVGIEVSEPMLEAARQRFAGMIAAGVVDLRSVDLRRAYPPVRASLTLSVLTLQFVPIEYRQRVVRNAYEHVMPGGAFVVVEKILGDTADIDTAFVDLYYSLKREHGYSQDAIDRKRLALEGVLVPMTARWNEDMLKTAGFAEIDCFWRWMNFAAWVAVKR
jgi:tRNA (cmo5U34)-methyltransferase